MRHIKARTLRQCHLLRHIASDLIPFMRLRDVRLYCPHRAITLFSVEPHNTLIACNCGRVWVRERDVLVGWDDARVKKWLMSCRLPPN